MQCRQIELHISTGVASLYSDNMPGRSKRTQDLVLFHLLWYTNSQKDNNINISIAVQGVPMAYADADGVVTHKITN